MGEVHEGEDTLLGRRIAVKLVRFPDSASVDELERRFRREAKVMARLCHPGAPAIYDTGVYSDPVLGRRMFIVMEYIDGTKLGDVVELHHPLPVGWVAAIGAQIAAVLAAAHACGILHRDLKPDNLMLCKDGSVKVLDFGLALLDEPGVSKLTQTGQALGTAYYMPPEQIQANTRSPKSDLYALGCVLYELFTNQTPFTGETNYALYQQHINTAPRPLRDLRPGVPEELDEFVRMMLAKPIEERPADAETVHGFLARYVTGATWLPDVTDQAPSPLRMYAQVLSRVLNTPPPVPESRPVGLTAAAIAAARREAASLARDSRPLDAAELLLERVASASEEDEALTPDVLGLLTQAAYFLTEAGEPGRAAPVLQRLVPELTRLYGSEDDKVFQCRLQEAACHRDLGDAGLALRLLRELHADSLDAFSADDPRLLELRRQIGDLESRLGEADSARLTLTDLHADLTRRFGPDHPSVSSVQRSLSELNTASRSE